MSSAVFGIANRPAPQRAGRFLFGAWPSDRSNDDVLLEFPTRPVDFLPAAEFFRLTVDQYHQMANLGILY
jgi:hypothetical protein